LVMRVLVLGGLLLAMWVLSLAIAIPFSGRLGITASGVAALICIFGGLGGMLISDLFRGTPYMAYGSLAGTLPRMALPLGLILLFHFKAPALMDAGLPLYLVAYYMPILLIETVWSLPEPTSKDS
jgi:hypothetical protein